MSLPDRLEALRLQNMLTGIDFIWVSDDQLTLDVYFHVAPSTLVTPLPGTLARTDVRIEGPDAKGALRLVPVATLAWATELGREVLRLTVDAPGDFVGYTLRIDDARIDPYYNDVAFRFQASCESALDCAPEEELCVEEAQPDVHIDYRERDFEGLRDALLEMAALRYPRWSERNPADLGVLVAEILAAVGDEHAYIQDRTAREATLATATRRRSLRRLGRLVDYELHEGLAASTWIELTVAASAAGGLASVPAGADVWAEADDGTELVFEFGMGLGDTIAGNSYALDRARNRLRVHAWDDEAACLPAGATSLHVKGHHAARLPLDDPLEPLEPGRWVCLRSDPVEGGRPALAWMVRLVAVTDTSDPLLNDPVTGHDLTKLEWERAQATPWALDYETLTVRGNMVPATFGRTFSARFRTGPCTAGDTLPEAVERRGPNGVTLYRFTLPDGDEPALAEAQALLAGLAYPPPVEPGGDLVWLAYGGPRGERLRIGGGEPRAARPEVYLHEYASGDATGDWSNPWTWRRSLLGTKASQPEDRHFTLEHGSWAPVVTHRGPGTEFTHWDDKGDGTTSIRFGDGEFSRQPPAGTTFRVAYRLGSGRGGNLPASAVSRFDSTALPDIEAVSNPLAISDGEAPEPAAVMRQLAPEAFRAVAYRAVTLPDYREAAERLSFVQRAKARMRWTGSWSEVVATADPRDAQTLSAARRGMLTEQLDRFRQAGQVVQVRSPVYADIDLEIDLCVAPYAYPGEVHEAVLEALFDDGGFFDPDHFSYGDPLSRSELEAAVQAVEGVRGVLAVRVARRGHFAMRAFSELALPVADNEIVRVDNDRAHPERGTLRLNTEGGA